MEELLEVLGREESQYEELIELGGVKRDAVIHANIAQLDEVTEKEQEAASALLNLSHKRSQVLRDMATVLGKDADEMTVNKMVGYLESQPEEQRKLIEKRDRLLDAGARMQAVNRQNEELLKQAMEMVEFDMTLLRSMRQAPETANYDKTANNTGDLLGGGAFDAKQ